MKKPVPTFSEEKIAFHGKTFAIVRKNDVFGERTRTLEIAKRAPGTRLIVENADGTILLVKEFREELNRYDMRLPGGKVFDSLDEYLTAVSSNVDLSSAIEHGAKKEGKEEVGIDGGNFKWLGKSVCGLTVEWDLHYFLVSDITVGKQNLEEDEDIEVVSVSRSEARDMCLNGMISEERSALQLFRYLQSCKEV